MMSKPAGSWGNWLYSSIRDIVLLAFLGVPLSLLAYFITLLALSNSNNGFFVEANKFNPAVALLDNSGIDASIALSFLFATLPFILLLIFRISGVLDTRTSQIYGIGLVAFSSFDATHDIILVLTASNYLSVLIPITVAVLVGIFLWSVYKKRFHSDVSEGQKIFP